MPYHPNIPQSSDDPTNSQQDLLDNFAKIATDWNVNHIALTSGSTPGFHSQVFFPTPLDFTADPNLTAPATSVYPKTDMLGLNNLFFQNDSTAASVAQLTNLPVVNGTITNITVAANGVVTTATPHGLSDGDTVVIYGNYGMVEINGLTATVASATSLTFQTGINTSVGFTAFSGVAYYVNSTVAFPASTTQNYGFISPWGLIFNMGRVPANAGTGTINFAIPYAVSNALLLYANATNHSAVLQAPALNTFTRLKINYTSIVPIYYVVVGV